jgi:hypothetical protein
MNFIAFITLLANGGIALFTDLRKQVGYAGPAVAPASLDVIVHQDLSMDEYLDVLCYGKEGGARVRETTNKLHNPRPGWGTPTEEEDAAEARQAVADSANFPRSPAEYHQHLHQLLAEAVPGHENEFHCVLTEELVRA